MPEPERLKAGKEFHKLIQQEWENTAQGAIISEKRVRRKKKRGRVDVFVDDDGDGSVAIIEIKNSDWDVMTAKAVRRNARRQIRQIWNYIDSQLDREKTVSAGVIFPRLPRDPERTRLLEALFIEEGIQVVWHDETMEELKARMGED